MKTRMLWALILSVAGTALYLGLVRPEASTVPKRVQEYLANDPSTLPAVELPPMVVSESRLPATEETTAESPSPHGTSGGQQQPTTESATKNLPVASPDDKER